MDLNSMGPLTYGIFSVNILENIFGDLQQFEKYFLFSSLILCKNTVYDTYNIPTIC